VQKNRIVFLITTIGVIVLALGVALGYAFASGKTMTITSTQYQIIPTTIHQTETVATGFVSGQQLEVVTATLKPVLVAQYTPRCETVNETTTTVYSEVPLAESTTITVIFPDPSILPLIAHDFVVTVTTNNTNTFSSEIISTSVSC